jgi:hypothetical protein
MVNLRESVCVSIKSVVKGRGKILADLEFFIAQKIPDDGRAAADSLTDIVQGRRIVVHEIVVIYRSDVLRIKSADVALAVNAVAGDKELGLSVQPYNILNGDIEYFDHELEVGFRNNEIA